MDLQVGQVVKNYKVLCDLLGEPVKGGKSKQLQIAKWQKHIGFIREKQAFHIIEIYPQKDNEIIATKGIYGRYLDKLVIGCLMTKGKIDEPFGTLFVEYIPILTKKYLEAKNKGIKAYAKQIGVSEYVLENYLFFLTNKLKTSFTKSLSRLEKNGYIRWEYKYTIYDRIANVQEATREEVELIKRIEGLAIEEFEITNKCALRNPKLYNNYRRFIKRLLEEENFSAYWKQYNIALVKEPWLEYDTFFALEELKEEIKKQVKISLFRKTLEGEQGIYYPFQTSKCVEQITALEHLFF